MFCRPDIPPETAATSQSKLQHFQDFSYEYMYNPCCDTTSMGRRCLLTHLLVELAHLRRVDVLRHVAALEEALDAAHLLHHLRELGVLLEQVVDLA